jgi:hypothetical protein
VIEDMLHQNDIAIVDISNALVVMPIVEKSDDIFSAEDFFHARQLLNLFLNFSIDKDIL